MLRKNSRIDISNFSDWERGYLTGLFFGDGNFYIEPRKGKYRSILTFDAESDGKIIERVLPLLRRADGNPYKQRLENRIRITTISRPLYDFLNDFVSYKNVMKGEEKIRRKYNIRNFTNWNSKKRYGFVAGVIDSDGFVGADRIKYRRTISQLTLMISLTVFQV